MNIYISHAQKDIGLALQLAKLLVEEGFTVVHPELKIGPGGNWAMKVANALEKSDFMIFLVTPGAAPSDWLRMDAEYAIGSRKFAGRVFTVLLGRATGAGKDVPWILLRLPHRQVESSEGFAEVVTDIESQCNAAEAGSSNA